MNNAPASPKDDPTKLTEWPNEPALGDLKYDYDQAKVEFDTHKLDVDTWLDNLNITGSAKLPKQKNRSSIQPKLIRKQAEWRYSSLSEPFMSTDDVFNVSPVTYEDKEAAAQNQLILNHQFNNQLPKVAFFDEYVRAAVDEGTVVIRTGWDYEEETIEVEQPVYETVVDNSPAFAEQLQQAIPAYQSNPEEFEQQAPQDLVLSIKASMENQQPVRVTQTGVEMVEEISVLKNEPTAEVCNYNNVIPDPTCKGDLNKAKFVVYRFLTSKEELRSTGLYTNLDDLESADSSILGDPDYNSEDNSSFNFNDDARKKFLAYEYWGCWDIDDNGTVKQIVATWVGATLIRMEENPFPDKKIPFIFIPFLPVRKSLYGQPDGELIKDNQDVVGAVTRGMIDILASNANGQKGTRKDALDTVNKRRYDQGKDYEYNGNADPRTAFYTHTFAEIPNSSQFMYGQQNQEAESLTGVKSFNDGISGQALGDTATGVRGALDASSKRELGILRRLADGVVQIGKKFLSMNSEFLSDEEIIRITNEEFVAVKRETLAGNFDLKLSISTAEEDNQKAQELSFMLQTMGNTMDPAMSFIILADIAKLRKMPELSKKIQEYKPEPDPLAQEKAMLEIELLKAQIAEVTANAQENGAQAQLHASRAANLSSDTDQKNLNFVEQESGVEQERNLQKQAEQAKANSKLEIVKAALNANKK
jgi:hypothetical protein